jgi:uncharacterized membrane protein YuzA (DUF378 family)
MSQAASTTSRRAVTRHITLSSFFIALGLLLPMVFHLIGIGSTFLPMFWPVAIGAFLLPWPYALSVALGTPILSSLLTGMPPVSPPILHMMLAELSALALVIALFPKNKGQAPFWALLAGILVSRAVGFMAAMLLARLLGLPPTWSAAAMMIKGLPGLAIMIVLIPVLVKRLQQLATEQNHEHA